jgi:4-amino-4-deoxy-L-arabinose transferase-like glycosyltransferase
VSIRTARSGPTASSAGVPASRRLSDVRRTDLVTVAALVIGAGLIEFWLRRLLTRPFYYDEGWRAYNVALGSKFLSQLHASAGPLALGWVGIENAARLVFGDTEAGLRAPMFLALPVLAVATYLLARRWLGAWVSLCVAALLLFNTWIINYALQLKSYSYEGLLAIVAIALFLLLQRADLSPARRIGLYALLGLACVFSLPNLFVVGPLLVLDFVRAVRARQAVVLRIAGEALAAVIALAHYLAFVRPQSGVADIAFQTRYAPHAPGAFVRFVIEGIGSYVPLMVTGVAGGARSVGTPSYVLPAAAHYLIAVVLWLLLAAGIVTAARDAAGRALVVAVGGALLLQLIASAVHRWPFGMLRVNVFLLPLLYLLAGIGAVALARLLRGPRRADGRSSVSVTWWRAIAAGAAAVALAGAGVATSTATVHALAQTSQLQTTPTMFGGVSDAVADARLEAHPGDLVIIRTNRSTPTWYAGPWLYYMLDYHGYPATVAARPRIPARDTFPVVRVTPRAVRRFLTRHAASPVIFLFEYVASGAWTRDVPGKTFPPAFHQQSLRTLRQFGYCPVSDVGFSITGHLTILSRAGCTGT